MFIEDLDAEALCLKLTQLEKKQQDIDRDKLKLNRDIGDAVKKAREAADMSMVDMKRFTGLSPAYMSDLENGKRTWTKELVRNVASAIQKNRKPKNP